MQDRQTSDRRGARAFRRDQSGATAIEYAIIAVLIAVGIAAGTRVSGNGLNLVFAVIGNQMAIATSTAEANSSN